MDINRLRRLAGFKAKILNESISQDPATNAKIEELMVGMEPERQSKYLTALEALQNAGRDGLTGKEWVASYKKMRLPDIEADASATVVTCARMFFGTVVEKIGGSLADGDRYRWIIDGTSDVPQDLRNAIEKHVNLTSELMKHAQNAESFSQRSLARVAMRVGLDSNTAMLAAITFLNHHPGMFTALGGGDYEIKEEFRKKKMSKGDYSQMFKDIANNASRANLGDDE